MFKICRQSYGLKKHKLFIGLRTGCGSCVSAAKGLNSGVFGWIVVCLNPKVLTKKNAAKSTILRRNLWLAVIDELRTKSSEIILSLTEELKIVYEHMVDIYKTRTKK